MATSDRKCDYCRDAEDCTTKQPPPGLPCFKLWKGGDAYKDDRIKELEAKNDKRRGLLKESALHLESDCKNCDRCEYTEKSACDTGFLLFKINAAIEGGKGN